MDNIVEDDWVGVCENLWELLTGLILDTRTPIERVYQAVKHLKDLDILDFRTLQAYSIDDISEYLKESGYPWYRSKAGFLKQSISLDLATASYEDMMSIKGIGPKLASLWMAIVHGSNDYPIIDVHVKNWLYEKGYTSKKYEELAKAFKEEAKKLNMSVLELDKKIINEGIKKRRNNG